MNMLEILIFYSLLLAYNHANPNLLRPTYDDSSLQCVKTILQNVLAYPLVTIIYEPNQIAVCDKVNYFANYLQTQEIAVLLNAIRSEIKENVQFEISEYIPDPPIAAGIHFSLYLRDARTITLNYSCNKCRALLMDNSSNIYAFVPFKLELQYLGACDNIDVNELKRFYFEPQVNFADREYRVLALKSPPYITDSSEETHSKGVEVNILNEFGSSYNMSFNVSLLPTGASNAINLIRLNPHFILGIAHTVGFYDKYLMPFQSEITVVVPAAAKIPNWLGFVKVFSIYLWSAIAIALVLFLTTTWLLSKFVPYHNSYANFISCSIQIIALLIGQSMKEPGTSTFNILFLTFVLFSFIITSAYNSFFLSYLVYPLFSKQIHSIEEALDSNLTFTGSGDYFMWSQMLFSKNIISPPMTSYETCNNDQCLENVYQFRNVAYFTNLEFLHEKINVNVTNKLHYFKLFQTYRILYCRINMEKMVDLFKDFIIRLNEVGVLNKWLMDAKYMVTKSDDSFTQLSFGHFGIAWGLAVAGWTLAVFVFCYELKK